MEVLHLLKVNIFRIVVLFGTFALAMAFAGNDLVNFIGTPLAGLESFLDYSANGAGQNANDYMMTVLAGESQLPFKHLFLIAAGVVMTVAICTSKKAHKVVETTVNLSRQDEGEEVFSSSRLARRTVRAVLNTTNAMSKHVPKCVSNWVNTRFYQEGVVMAEGAAFDQVRAAVNLVMAGFLIVVGTSLQLPLSTTYVAFMVAMGSSLADRAWGRETAVYRITGVITVIGGWFITAGAAFIVSFLIATINHWGGFFAMILVMCGEERAEAPADEKDEHALVGRDGAEHRLDRLDAGGVDRDVIGEDCGDDHDRDRPQRHCEALERGGRDVDRRHLPTDECHDDGDNEGADACLVRLDVKAAESEHKPDDRGEGEQEHSKQGEH